MVHAIDGRPTGGTVVADAGHATASYSQSPQNGEINNKGRRSSDLQRLSSEQQALSAATQLPGGWPQTPGANGTHNSTVREGLGGKDGSILTIPNGSHSSDRTPSAKAASLSARSKKSSGTMNGSENGMSNEHRSSEANRDANSRSAVSPDGYFGSYPANTKPSTPRSPMSRPVAFPTVDTTPNQSARTSAYGTVPTTPVAALSPVKESSPAPSGPVAEDMLKPPPQKPHHHRASSPPAFTPNGSSSPSILPMSRPDRLVHRHTLEVPKVITRTSKDGQDPTSDSAVHASGRFSPNTPTKRRGSLQLVRKQTKSVASDMPLDEFAQDEDAARWAEIIKAKRAKKQREDIDDERVVVGTKVDEHHVNYVTAYNMLTGIRFCVSRCNAKLDRALEPSDFAAKHKFSFDIAGNELTPSAKYDFKFKDYAPWVFRHMRAAFQIDPADYLMSLTAKYILSELGSPGKSGSFFYFSRDYKYIIKTIHHGEHKFLRKILVDYYNHVQDNPNTLLSQFYGLHRVKIPYGRKIHFVVMNNLFPPHRDIHRTFDLKGSTIGRDFKEEDLEKNPRATLKDLNWLRRNLHLEFGPTKKAAFVEQMQKDVALLQRLKIMDYSLLVGFHDLERGNEENLRDKTLQVFQPGGASKQDDSAGAGTVMAPGPGSLARTPSKMENAKRARELRDLVQKQRPIPMDQAIDKMPEAAGRDGFFFYADDGGFRATHEDDRPGEEIYYLGIIDCLTRYTLLKRAEHFYKGLGGHESQISPIPPERYGDRFIRFISGITMSREHAALVAEKERLTTNAAGVAIPAGSIDGIIEDPHLSATTSRNPSGTAEVLHKAEAMAEKSKKTHGPESDLPDRLMTTISPPSSATDNNDGIVAPTTLPVIGEAAESASNASPRVTPVPSRASLVEPETTTSGTSNHEDSRTARSSTPPHYIIGGRAPPTPPKDPHHIPNSRPSSSARSSAELNLDKRLPLLPGPAVAMDRPLE